MSSYNRPKRKHRRTRSKKSGQPQVDFPMCPVCQKAVRDLCSAITHQETGNPAHFDCILKTLREVHNVQQDEKICYLGKGSFGIVQFRQHSSPLRFFIRKRIQYEENDLFPEWRRQPAVNPSSR